MRLPLFSFGAFAHVVHARIGSRVRSHEPYRIQTTYFGEDEAYWSRFLDDASMSFPTAAPTTAPKPDFGPNVRIFDPSMSTSEIQAAFDSIWELQRNNEMGTERYGLYFLPGVYGTDDEPLQIKIGYYTEVGVWVAVRTMFRLMARSRSTIAVSKPNLISKESLFRPMTR